MGRSPWLDELLSSTRGRVLVMLRRRPRTVAELATELGITGNAVRTHLGSLEKDGLVVAGDLRREGVGKPARVWSVTPAAEAVFPKAYAAVLEALVAGLRTRMGPGELERFLDGLGTEIGREHVPGDDADPRHCLDHAVELLASLGADVEVTETDGSVHLDGAGCPLSATVASHPEMCRLVRSLVEEVVGLPVEERCRRDGARPRCHFVVSAPASLAPPSAG